MTSIQRIARPSDEPTTGVFDAALAQEIVAAANVLLGAEQDERARALRPTPRPAPARRYAFD